jgi:hypothetical protein
MEDTTLIIGAGANKEVHEDIDLGTKLIENIANRVTDRTSTNGSFLSNALKSELGITDSTRNEFLIHLDHYLDSVENPSIDEFLYEIASYPEFDSQREMFLNIGRVLIVAHVLGWEGTETRKRLENEINEKKTWLSVIGDLIEKHRLLGKSNLKIITFNYDRILEYFLATRFGDSARPFINKNIVHVYGRIGYFNNILPLSQKEKKIEFGHDNGDLKEISKVKDQIRLVLDRENNQEVKKVKQIISIALKRKATSKTLVFGYGLNPVNNARIELGKCSPLGRNFCFNVYPGAFPTYNFTERRRTAAQVRTLAINADIHYKSCADFVKTCLSDHL